MYGVADEGLLSVWLGVCVEGARVGYDDFGLTSGSGGGASGIAEADTTAVDITLSLC